MAAPVIPTLLLATSAGTVALSSAWLLGPSAAVAALPLPAVAAAVAAGPWLVRRLGRPEPDLARRLPGVLAALAFLLATVWCLAAGPAGVPAVLAALVWPAMLALLRATGSPPLALLPAVAAAAVAAAAGDGAALSGLAAGLGVLALGGWRPGAARGLLAASLALAAAALPAGALLLGAGAAERLPAPVAAVLGLRSGAADALLASPLVGHGIGAAGFAAPAAPRTVTGRFAALDPAEQAAVARMLGYRGELGRGGLSAHLAAVPEAGALWRGMEQARRWEIPDGAGNGRVVFGGFAALPPAEQAAVARMLGYHGPLGHGGLSAHLAAVPEAGALWRGMEQARRWETGNPQLAMACPAPACNGLTRLWLDGGAAGALPVLVAALLWLARSRRLEPTAEPVALAFAAGVLVTAIAGGATGGAGWGAGVVLAGLALPAAAAVPRRRPSGGVLIIRPGGLHGFVSALPAFAALGRHHADERLTLLTTPGLAPFARRSGLFDEVWSDPPGGSPVERAALGRRLRAAGFRLVYDLQGGREGRLCRRLLGRGPLAAWLALPWSDGEWPGPDWSGPPGNGAEDPADDPQERHRRQLAACGIAVPELPDVSWLTADTGRFGLPADVALLVPDGPDPGLDRHWPPNHYAKLARALVQAGIRPVILGAGRNAELARRIRASCPEAVDLSGTATVSEIAALARRARVAVGGDSGALRLIAAAGCRTVALLQEPAVTHGPRGPRVMVLRAPCLALLPMGAVLRAIVDLVEAPGAPDRDDPGTAPAASAGRGGAFQRADRVGQGGAPVEGG